MGLSHFMIFISILVSGWLWTYGSFQFYFQDSKIEKEKIKILQESLDREKLRVRVSQENLLDFKQEVAKLISPLLPTKSHGDKGYPLRKLASVTIAPHSDKVKEQIGLILFQRGKERFRKGEYTKAIEIFLKVMNQYSYSVNMSENMFLLMESYFQTDQKEECIKMVERMVELFPGNEMTGFSLLRMGKIFEFRQMPDEALDVYKLVIKSFTQPQVVAQATQSLSKLDF